jgi:hypothetical protein
VKESAIEEGERNGEYPLQGRQRPLFVIMNLDIRLKKIRKHFAHVMVASTQYHLSKYAMTYALPMLCYAENQNADS